MKPTTNANTSPPRVPTPYEGTYRHATADQGAIHVRTRRGIDYLNFFLADVQTGLGPFVAIFLTAAHWNAQSTGLALTIGGIAGIAAQAPAGALVDAVQAKRSLIAGGVIFLAIGALITAFFPTFWPVVFAQALIGVTSSVFGPAVAAISLGVVGRRLFDRRQGRNQTFNSAGNVVAALCMGLIGYCISNRAIFYFVAAMTWPALVSLALINPRDIDYDLARGGGNHAARSSDKTGMCNANASNANVTKKHSGILALLRDRRLVIFLACCVLFHFANAAMLPLLGELLSKGKGKASMAFMSACVVTTQLVVTLIAGACGLLAARFGRKPIMLAGFCALPIRGLLYTLTHNAALLVAIQILDGIGAAVFGVVSVLIIADLTRGTGRFNLAQGAIGAAVGIGAALSQGIAGAIVHHMGFNAGFLFLAVIAAGAASLFIFAMPETLHAESDGFPAERSDA